jgi:hypothetical protein
MLLNEKPHCCKQKNILDYVTGSQHTTRTKTNHFNEFGFHLHEKDWSKEKHQYLIIPFVWGKGPKFRYLHV